MTSRRRRLREPCDCNRARRTVGDDACVAGASTRCCVAGWKFVYDDTKRCAIRMGVAGAGGAAIAPVDKREHETKVCTGPVSKTGSA